MRTPTHLLTVLTAKHDSSPLGAKWPLVENGGLQPVYLDNVPSGLAMLGDDASLNGEPQSSHPLVPRMHESPPKDKPDGPMLTHHPSEGALTLQGMTLGASEPTGPKPHPHTTQASRGAGSGMAPLIQLPPR